MKLSTTYDGAGAVVHVEGRLDAEWAVQLGDALDDLLSSGVRTAVVDLAAVSYVSSAGARVLLRSAGDFAALRGELYVATAPPLVADTLGAAGLEHQLLAAAPGAGDPRVRTSGVFAAARATTHWRTPTSRVASGRYEASPHEAGATLACRLYGGASGVTGPVEFPERVFGLGLGAIGDRDECFRSRAGELVGAAGVVAYLPTEGAHVPDYLAALRGRAPSATLDTGLTCEGACSHLVRFSAARAGESVPLAEVAGVCLDAVGGDAAGLVMVAEVAELVGASRRRPLPTDVGAAERFALPALREWLAFTAEPAYARTTALVVGVVARRPEFPLAAQLRPLAARGDPTHGELHGHFHAAVFTYSPVPQRTVTPESVVASLVERETLRAVIHLLRDQRDGAPRARESELVRGFAWTAPIATTATAGPA
ncbi:MAG: STAS domain-containing protein [Gemmatimonadaceae bacterium]